MAFLFALTLLISAFLLFWVQPLIAKMLLPVLGGTPGVWNTCLLFFQAVLLAGYAYVLAVDKWLDVRRQVALHACLLLLAVLFFPFDLSRVAPPDAAQSPAGWLLLSLSVAVGLPFFVVSATSPLLQKWFARTAHPAAGDPYFLFAASNAGSLLALLAFPLLLEPTLKVRSQSWLWAGAYGVLIILILMCATALRRSRARRGAEATTASTIITTAAAAADAHLRPRANRHAPPAVTGELSAAVGRGDRARWMALAFVPSSLMLGVTAYVSTDVAATPLLWIIPLVIYLVTFILAFAKARLLPSRLLARIFPGAALIITLIFLSGATEPGWFLIVTHLFFFFIAALICHGRLAESRPTIDHLAEFYLWVAVGGALGGIFNALVAPRIFDTVAEYPLTIVLACLFGLGGLRQDGGADGDGAEVRRERRLDLILPPLAGVLAAGLALAVTCFDLGTIEQLAVVLGIPLMLVYYFFAKRSVRFALGIGAVMLGSTFYTQGVGRTLHAERNFFGTLRVTLDPSGTSRRLYHGSTIHGRQFVDRTRRCEPLSYYHPRGPLGRIFDAYNARPAAARIAVVGLGTGATAAYARPGQQWTVYEINPAVVRLARDIEHFTYLQECAGAPVEIVLGDARLRLQQAPDSHFGLIILDAFSSDAIPVHLMTREALEMYLAKLADGGLVAFHISNRSLHLHPVVGALAKSLGLTGLVFNDTEADRENGKEPSQWVVLSRRPEALIDLVGGRGWQPLSSGRAGGEVWSDDFSNIISVFKWQ